MKYFDIRVEEQPTVANQHEARKEARVLIKLVNSSIQCLSSRNNLESFSLIKQSSQSAFSEKIEFRDSESDRAQIDVIERAPSLVKQQFKSLFN